MKAAVIYPGGFLSRPHRMSASSVSPQIKWFPASSPLQMDLLQGLPGWLMNPVNIPCRTKPAASVCLDQPWVWWGGGPLRPFLWACACTSEVGLQSRARYTVKLLPPWPGDIEGTHAPSAFPRYTGTFPLLFKSDFLKTYNFTPRCTNVKDLMSLSNYLRFQIGGFPLFKYKIVTLYVNVYASFPPWFKSAPTGCGLLWKSLE